MARPMASLLKEARVQTAGFSESPYVTAVFGMHTGFDTFREYFPHRVLEERPRDFDRMDSEWTIEDVVAWLDEHNQERFFGYVHLLPPHVEHWKLTTLRDKLIKVGSKMVRHARYVTFPLAEVAIPRLYGPIPDRIRRFAAIGPRAAPTRSGAMIENVTHDDGATLLIWVDVA